MLEDLIWFVFIGLIVIGVGGFIIGIILKILWELKGIILAIIILCLCWFFLYGCWHM